MSDKAEPAKRRGVRIALAVSVALNLGVLGMAAGAMLHGGGLSGWAAMIIWMAAPGRISWKGEQATTPTSLTAVIC